MTLLSLLYLPDTGFLAEIADYLFRMEDMSHILVWTKSDASTPKVINFIQREIHYSGTS